MSPSHQHEDGMTPARALTEEALAWLVRTNDPEFADWEGFTVWLEADSRRADEYHRLAQSELLVGPALASFEPELVQDNEPPRRGWQRAWGIAASVLLVGLTGALLALPNFTARTYSTKPGQTRTIALASGDEMLLNGGSRVEVGGWKGRDVRVEQGQALFRLAGAERLEVRSGDLEIVDIGTVFEVSRTDDRSRVIVDEGAVMVDPDGAGLTLAAGQQVEAEDGATRLRAQPAPPGSAGAWTRGQLVYLNAPIADVAADLRRSTGLAFSTSSAMGARRFSGTLNIADVRRDPSSLGPLMGVPVQQAGNGWRLGEGR